MTEKVTLVGWQAELASSVFDRLNFRDDVMHIKVYSTG